VTWTPTPNLVLSLAVLTEATNFAFGISPSRRLIWTKPQLSICERESMPSQLR
jgi:hypothetical protein